MGERDIEKRKMNGREGSGSEEGKQRERQMMSEGEEG